MATTTHDGTDIPLDALKRRRRKGNPGIGRVLFTLGTIILLAGLFGGFLGASSAGLL